VSVSPASVPINVPFRQFRVVGGDQDASLVVPQVNVTPSLPDDYESEVDRVRRSWASARSCP